MSFLSKVQYALWVVKVDDDDGELENIANIYSIICLFRIALRPDEKFR